MPPSPLAKRMASPNLKKKILGPPCQILGTPLRGWGQVVETSLPPKISDFFLKSEGKEVEREIRNKKGCRGGGGPGGGGVNYL